MSGNSGYLFCQVGKPFWHRPSELNEEIPISLKIVLKFLNLFL